MEGRGLIGGQRPRPFESNILDGWEEGKQVLGSHINSPVAVVAISCLCMHAGSLCTGLTKSDALEEL